MVDSKNQTRVPLGESYYQPYQHNFGIIFDFNFLEVVDTKIFFGENRFSLNASEINIVKVAKIRLKSF
jgi:hypothetical protein